MIKHFEIKFSKDTTYQQVVDYLSARKFDLKFAIFVDCGCLVARGFEDGVSRRAFWGQHDDQSFTRNFD